jgi:hypothetical protein
MAIIPFPRNMLRSARWQQEEGRVKLQRSAWNNRTRAFELGGAARWGAECEPVPANLDGRHAMMGFEAASQVPGNLFRLPATERSQYGAAIDNLIQNPEFATSSAPWTLESAWTLIDTGAPADIAPRGLYTDSTRAANNATANAATPITIAAGQVLFLSTDVFRATGSTGTLSMAANFLNSGGTLISTLGMNLVSVATANAWQRARVTLTAPAGTASAIVYYNNGLTAGFAAVTGARASLWPERVLVASGSSGRSLNLYSMIPSALHLRAGQLLTVTLPSGDEQLVRLTADLQASVSGTATAQLATPLREVPAADAPVEIARPWALMRATNEPGWSVEPGPIYGMALTAEEAF